MDALWTRIFNILCVQAYVCICLCVFEKEEKEGEMQRKTDQIGTGQTAEELRWKTDLIAAVMLH